MMPKRTNAAHWLIKLSAVVAYCFILFPGEHVGGPLLFFVLFGTADGGFVGLVCALVLITLFLMLLSMAIASKGVDRFLFPIGLSLLALPIIDYFPRVIEHPRFAKSFIPTLTLFVLLMALILHRTFRRNENTTATTRPIAK